MKCRCSIVPPYMVDSLEKFGAPDLAAGAAVDAVVRATRTLTTAQVALAALATALLTLRESRSGGSAWRGDRPLV